MLGLVAVKEGRNGVVGGGGRCQVLLGSKIAGATEQLLRWALGSPSP